MDRWASSTAVRDRGAIEFSAGEHVTVNWPQILTGAVSSLESHSLSSLAWFQREGPEEEWAKELADSLPRTLLA